MASTIDLALGALSSRMSEALPLLEAWVRTNSYTANISGVNAVGELLGQALTLPGLAGAKEAGTEGGDHWVWKSSAWGSAPGVLLVGHHDTVFPEESFEVWERDGDRLSGPGVLDMKGGLVVIRSALAALSDVGLLDRIPVALVSVGDEETGSEDSQPLLQHIAKDAACALVFEAGRAEDRIITARKGTGGMTARATGVAAHAGNHHREGRNAVWALAKLTCAVQELTDYNRGVTLNVGWLRGGDARNTVPGLAECGIDLRFVKVADGHAIADAVRGLASEISEQTGVKIEVEGGVRRLPLERTEASAELYNEYGACAKLAGLGAEESPLLGGGSDASTVAVLGVPAIDGLGPRGRGFHTHDEFIEVSSLDLRANALVRFLVGRMT